MRNLLTPIILVAIAIGLFVTYTNPTYESTKEIRTKVASYNEALTKVQELKKLRDELIAKRNSFSTEDLTRLQRMLPDNVDNIRLIIDIDGIAARHGLMLSDVKLGEVSKTSTDTNELAVGESTDVVGSVTLDFSLTASYDNLLVFLQDLEHSLRVIDIEEMAFSVPETGGTKYDFTIRTYWLR